jgi:hypothetical protein
MMPINNRPEQCEVKGAIRNSRLPGPRMQDITRNVPFQGDASKAMDAAAGVLMPHGFRVARRSERAIEFEGPSFMYGHRSPYWGASRCLVRAEGGRLDLEVQMDRMRRSNRLGALFGAAMICVIWFMVGIFVAMNPRDRWPVLLPVFGLPTVVVPLIYVLAGPLTRDRTNKAFERLLQNAAMMGGSRS